MFERYGAADALLRSGQFAQAAEALAAIASEAPDYQSASKLLLEAREGITTQARYAMDAGSKLAASGDLPGAMAEYQRAKTIAPSLGDLPDLIRQLTDRMVREGNEHYARARQYDALGRNAEAAEAYDRVLKLLPPDDPKSGIAQARLKVLRVGGR
jgi:tetratricopeptide (TPR) repeat protein